MAEGELGPEGLLDEDLARRQRIAYRAEDKSSTLRLLAAVHRLAPAPPLPERGPSPPSSPVAYLGALRAELDGSASIGFDRQLALLGRLSAEAEDANRHPEVAALVQLFLGRRDIAAYVERDLTRLRAQLDAARPKLDSPATWREPLTGRTPRHPPPGSEARPDLQRPFPGSKDV